MSENHTVTHPLPEGVYDNFTYACNTCGGTVTVISSTRQPHTCPSTERDELANVIFEQDMCQHRGDARDVAAAILAAGYRKPQQVTTVQELDALPVESVVRSDMGNVYVKDYDLEDPSAIWWVIAGAVSEFQSSRIALPATVLHRGAE